MPDPETEIALLKQKVEHLEEWVKDWLRRVAADKESEKEVRRDQGKRVEIIAKELTEVRQSKDSVRSVWDRILNVLAVLVALIAIIMQIINK